MLKPDCYWIWLIILIFRWVKVIFNSPYKSLINKPYNHNSMSVETFYNILIDDKQSVGERTKAVFELKHLQTTEGVEALLKGFQYLG